MREDDPIRGTDRRVASRGERSGVIAGVEGAIRYPTESDDVVRTVVIGGLLVLFGFLVVPLFVVGGYAVRVLDRTASGDDAPPTFDEWGEMTVTGLKAVVISFVYVLLPTVVGGGVFLIGVLGAGVSGEGAIAGLGLLGAMLGGLLWVALSLLVAYLVPAALANFAETRTLGAGFDLGTLKPVWLSRTYALGWATAFLVLLIGGLVTAVLNVVPVLGTIAGSFVGFYFAVAAYSVIGHTWADASTVPRRDHETLNDPAV